jgi:hypothetical protein
MPLFPGSAGDKPLAHNHDRPWGDGVRVDRPCGDKGSCWIVCNRVSREMEPPRGELSYLRQ